MRSSIALILIAVLFSQCAKEESFDLVKEADLGVATIQIPDFAEILYSPGFETFLYEVTSNSHNFGIEIDYSYLNTGPTYDENTEGATLVNCINTSAYYIIEGESLIATIQDAPFARFISKDPRFHPLLIEILETYTTN